MRYVITETGKQVALCFLRECAAKRKEILDAGLDTNSVFKHPWELIDVELAVNALANDFEDGVYEDSWNVTDSYESDTPLRLVEGVDYIKTEN